MSAPGEKPLLLLSCGLDFIPAGPEFGPWAEHMAELSLFPRLLLPGAHLAAGYANWWEFLVLLGMGGGDRRGV